MNQPYFFSFQLILFDLIGKEEIADAGYFPVEVPDQFPTNPIDLIGKATIKQAFDDCVFIRFQLILFDLIGKE